MPKDRRRKKKRHDDNKEATGVEVEAKTMKEKNIEESK